MIVPMKKITLLCLKKMMDETLEKLQNLGVLHIETADIPESNDRSNIQKHLSKIKHVHNILKARKVETEKSENYKCLSGEDTAGLVLECLENISRLEKKLEHLKNHLEKLLPWGDFSYEILNGLKEKNLYVYLCESSRKNFPEISSQYETLNVNENKTQIFFIIISRTKLQEEKLPLVNLTENIGLRDTYFEIERCEKLVQENNDKIDHLTHCVKEVSEREMQLEEELQLTEAKDSMSAEGLVIYIEGFAPVTVLEQLKKTAEQNSWGLLIRDVSEDDNVPTLIKTPKIFNIAKPIFNFIGIAPGYREWDVSVCFLFFFTIFFGMIVGDAGYGAIFLVLAVCCKLVFKSEKAKLPNNLFLILSIATVIWGLLNGTFFGIDSSYLPGFMKGIKPLNDPAVKNKNIMWLCFLIAAVHLSMARFWKAVLYFRKTWEFLGQIGWGMLLWGNFFTAVELIVFKGTFPDFAYWLYGIGFALILVFGINWKDPGKIISSFMGFMGSFVDVLSYIRLFAVGLATFYIANSFNNMGMMLLDVSPWIIIGTVIIILFGHLLNIALAFMGVLVHGIRLNTLEFSNQMELEWSGHPYNPLKKRNPDNENSISERNEKKSEQKTD